MRSRISPRLSRAGAREHEQRSIAVHHRLVLRGIQPREQSVSHAMWSAPKYGRNTSGTMTPPSGC